MNRPTIKSEEREWAAEINLEDEEWQSEFFGGVVSTFDGCTVEPDGWCEHGFSSWMIVLNII